MKKLIGILLMIVLTGAIACNDETSSKNENTIKKETKQTNQKEVKNKAVIEIPLPPPPPPPPKIIIKVPPLPPLPPPPPNLKKKG